MRLFFNMMRVPNLAMIALTFLLLRYLVFFKVYNAYQYIPGGGSTNFLLMVITTLLIAAAGYISNDYFDVITDRVNKPGKLYIGKQVSAGSALAIAMMLSAIAIILSTWLSLRMRSYLPATLLMVALTVAWWYAVQLKKSFLWGNIAVSCMTAGTIAMAWLIEKQVSPVPAEVSGIISAIVVAISIFAFLLSMLREIVKDMEDMEGDRLIHCRSLPLRKGIGFTKTVLMLIAAFTFLLLSIAQFWLIRLGNNAAALWVIAGVELPLLYFVFSLKKATTKPNFHTLSTLLKCIMLGGLLTILAGQF